MANEKANEAGAEPRTPSTAEFDDLALRLLGYLGVEATHARQKLLADRLISVYNAGQRTGASRDVARLGTCGKQWHGGLGGKAPHQQNGECLSWRPSAGPSRGHSAECGGQPAGSGCICRTGFNDSAADLWMLLLECTGGHGPDCDPVLHIRAAFGRAGFWVRAQAIEEAAGVAESYEPGPTANTERFGKGRAILAAAIRALAETAQPERKTGPLSNP